MIKGKVWREILRRVPRTYAKLLWGDRWARIVTSVVIGGNIWVTRHQHVWQIVASSISYLAVMLLVTVFFAAQGLLEEKQQEAFDRLKASYEELNKLLVARLEFYEPGFAKWLDDEVAKMKERPEARGN